MVTLLFPGQGSQYVGMGQTPASQREWLTRADEVLGYGLSKLMLEGPEEELTLTHNTQPAIFVHSYMLFREVQKAGIPVGRVLGHSVGEYVALAAAGALSFEDGVRAVHLRGKFMQEATPPGEGKMIALLNLSEEDVRAACAAVEGVVAPANFNGPNQIVISGESGACDRVGAWLAEQKISHRAVPLKVSAPFHSPLMKPAGKKLAGELERISFTPLNIPYIANWDGRLYGTETSAQVLRENLVKQVDGAVLWTQSMGLLDSETLCLECGPGRVLMGLARKINRAFKVIPLDQEGGVGKAQEVLR